MKCPGNSGHDLTHDLADVWGSGHWYFRYNSNDVLPWLLAHESNQFTAKTNGLWIKSMKIMAKIINFSMLSMSPSPLQAIQTMVERCVVKTASSTDEFGTDKAAGVDTCPENAPYSVQPASHQYYEVVPVSCSDSSTHTCSHSSQNSSSHCHYHYHKKLVL